MSLKPWREIAIPHEDVLRGTFQQAEFAADISRVHEGTATGEYQDAKLFFERTFITEGMRLLLDSVIKRLTGRGGDPVIQLQTAFGGGKTHTMLAVYHLAKGVQPASQLQGIPPILKSAGITDLPAARIRRRVRRDRCALGRGPGRRWNRKGARRARIEPGRRCQIRSNRHRRRPTRRMVRYLRRWRWPLEPRRPGRGRRDPCRCDRRGERLE